MLSSSRGLDYQLGRVVLGGCDVGLCVVDG